MIRVPVQPELLRWARRRAGLGLEDLPARFKKLPEWEAGNLQPTLRQLEDLARKAHVPVGYLLLDEPPEETIPIPETVRGRPPRPSPDLLDTIYLCQARQGWYQDYLRSIGAEPLDFVGQFALSADPQVVADAMRDRLCLPVPGRVKHRTYQAAFTALIAAAETSGVLVMVSGTVGSSSHRKLDPRFRGFALTDPLAPLLFCQWCQCQTRSSVYAGARASAHLAGNLRAFEPAVSNRPEHPQRGSLVQRRRGGASRAARANRYRSATP